MPEGRRRACGPEGRAGWHRGNTETATRHQAGVRGAYTRSVVYQKWRSAEIDAILGHIFPAFIRKECPMPTLIAVRCPHCQNDQVAKRGKTARGTQRYLCQHPTCATGSFLLD